MQLSQFVVTVLQSDLAMLLSTSLFVDKTLLKSLFLALEETLELGELVLTGSVDLLDLQFVLALSFFKLSHQVVNLLAATLASLIKDLAFLFFKHLVDLKKVVSFLFKSEQSLIKVADLVLEVVVS